MPECTNAMSNFVYWTDVYMGRDVLPCLAWILHSQEDPGTPTPPLGHGLHRLYRPL